MLVVIFYAVVYGAFGIISVWIIFLRPSNKVTPLRQTEFAVNALLASRLTVLTDEMRHLYHYMESTLPVVFSSDIWYVRLKREVFRHHRYLSIFDSTISPDKRVLTLLHALTVQLILVFFLALFYDIEVRHVIGNIVIFES
jgi:hypothetical protein